MIRKYIPLIVVILLLGIIALPFYIPWPVKLYAGFPLWFWYYAFIHLIYVIGLYYFSVKTNHD